MANADGKWNCKVNSPMGEQAFVLTVTTAGNRFTGRGEGAMGAMEIEGEVDGDELIWAMRVSKPLPITLNCRATISGDMLEGKVSAGFMRSFAVMGVRI